MNRHHTAVPVTYMNSVGAGTQLLERGWTLLLSLQLPAVRARKLVGIAYIQLSYHVLEFSPGND